MGDAASSQLSDERLAKVAALDALAQGEGHTVLELAIAWLLSRPAVASVIAGATKPEQVAANVAAGRWRPGPDVLAQVDAIASPLSMRPSVTRLAAATALGLYEARRHHRRLHDLDVRRLNGQGSTGHRDLPDHGHVRRGRL